MIKKKPAIEEISYFTLDLEKAITLKIVGDALTFKRRARDLVRLRALREMDRQLNGIHSGIVELLEVNWTRRTIKKINNA